MIRIDKKQQLKNKYYCGGRSVVVPNQTVSIKKILNDFSSGSYSEYYRIGTYEDQVTFDSLCFEDFKDIAELEFACANSKQVLKAYEEACKRLEEAKNEEVKQNPLGEHQYEAKGQIEV